MLLEEEAEEAEEAEEVEEDKKEEEKKRGAGKGVGTEAWKKNRRQGLIYQYVRLTNHGFFGYKDVR